MSQCRYLLINCITWSLRLHILVTSYPDLNIYTQFIKQSYTYGPGINNEVILPTLKGKIIVTPAVYPRLVESLRFDIQSTGQKLHCVNTIFWPSQCYALIRQSDSPYRLNQQLYVQHYLSSIVKLNRIELKLPNNQ